MNQSIARPFAPFTQPVLNAAGGISVPWLQFLVPVADVAAMGPTLQDTRANRLNQNKNLTPYYDTARFLKYFFWETDTHLVYISQFPTGIVDTNGTTVNFVSGIQFNSTMVDAPITINGVQYFVTAVGSNLQLTIATSAGVQTGVSYTSSVATWQYVAGIASYTQSTLPTPGPQDAGMIVWVTDYNHQLRWNGAAWGWAPGENGSGFMQLFEVDPSPATGWHLYDGTANVPYLKSDGTTGTKTLPDLVSNAAAGAYPKAGSPNSGPNAAVAPTASGGGGTVDPNVTGLTVDSNITGITIGNQNASFVVQAGTGISAAAGAPTGNHQHPVTDPGHDHAVTDPGHDHVFTATQPTISDDGEPRNIVRRPFFRL